MAEITFIGGGSYGWMPPILGRMFLTPTMQGHEIVIMDLDARAAETIYQLGEALRRRFESNIRLSRTTDLARALDGADYVSLTISTGGLDAMKVDVETPEQYGIFQTVGDTVGPGGLNRALRNIPVILDTARQMQRRCPNAWLLNLTNPLTVLTRVVTRETNIKCAGLCQGVEEHVDYLCQLAGHERKDVQFTAAGIDHCAWLLDLKINGHDGIQLLKDRGYRTTDRASVQEVRDTFTGEITGVRAGFAIWREIGFLPGIGDRHMVENFPHFVTDLEQLNRYGVQRTSIAQRRENLAVVKERAEKLARDVSSLKFPMTHAPVIQMIDALEGHGSLLMTLNVENVGQIPELPLRANVETLCHIDRAGVHPITIGRPLKILEAILRPHVLRQELTIDAALSGDFNLAVSILATDPQIRRIADARPMLKEMMHHTRQWLPLFKVE